MVDVSLDQALIEKHRALMDRMKELGLIKEYSRAEAAMEKRQRRKLRRWAESLRGNALDYLVRCADRGEEPCVSVEVWAAENDYGWHPSTDWTQGGPIIEREGIALEMEYLRAPHWVALHGHLTNIDSDVDNYESIGAIRGRTPLEAAMRCYVLSKFGRVVEFPAG